ncbi:NAD-dependent epimerase/dehydratase family protein [Paenibacillus sp. GM2]|uniref:NAD-dependent epimerase/dehydratase family protein n=1 Tax=Paenibacillus sp. GM2 TaxID=1622070 RepID=UPI0008383763|nr:NAD(P)-dependent oxidoreductase [Paenibacillus sp. GM2]
MINNSLKKVAILGATGHIGKNVTKAFCKNGMYHLSLFVRSREKLVSFLQENNMEYANDISIMDFSNFTSEYYDVVINCTGIGNPGALANDPFLVFKVTEEIDNLVLNYIYKNPETLYINFSSGAIYGTDYEEPASESKKLIIDVNHLSNKDYYGISKLNMEAKHRSLVQNHIVDLRIFGFFSAYIDTQSRFFLTDILNSLNNNHVLNTSSEDMIRDYVHPSDLIAILDLCMNKHKVNDSFDAYSLKPVTKFELLDYFVSNHNLQVNYINDLNGQSRSITGNKNNYYSMNRNAEKIGYNPKFNSLQSVSETINLLKLGKNKCIK